MSTDNLRSPLTFWDPLGREDLTDAELHLAELIDGHCRFRGLDFGSFEFCNFHVYELVFNFLK